MSLDALPFGTLSLPVVFAMLGIGFQLAGLAMRNELWLRVLILTGTVFYLFYYATVPSGPMWEAMVGSALLFGVNLYALSFVVLDRSTWRMSDEMRRLYRDFPTFNPGQFRRIMRHASWQTATEDTRLCEEGNEPEGLYFLLDGTAQIMRGGKRSQIGPGGFLGEMSFLRGPGNVANATVIARAGARYVMWDRAKLHRQMRKSVPLSNAVNALFNKDLLGKLDRSWPEKG